MASKKIAVFGDLWKIAGAFLRESIAGLRGETSCPDFSAQGIEEKWCGRWELNPHGPCDPADFLTDYGFRRPDIAGLRSGLSLHLTP